MWLWYVLLKPRPGLVASSGNHQKGKNVPGKRRWLALTLGVCQPNAAEVTKSVTSRVD